MSDNGDIRKRKTVDQYTDDELAAMKARLRDERIEAQAGEIAAVVSDLAALSDIEYELQRAGICKKYGLRPSVLDGLRKAHRRSGERPADPPAQPFLALGFSDSHHFFLRTGTRHRIAIPVGAFTQSRLLELAPLGYWMAQGMTTDGDSLKTAVAQDYVGALSHAAGRYDPERIRGAGVWREGAEIIANDGEQIVRLDGSTAPYEAYESANKYLSSNVRFDHLVGPESDDDRGRLLGHLFAAQGWTRPIMALCAMGWSLLAPFGGILTWRPHIWVTGRKGTGKSWVLDNIITPLCGSFALIGNTETTAAGVRRELNQDARPCILDEMEAKEKRSKDRVESILQIVRNASSDMSARSTLAAGDGTVTYITRSCFCLASVRIPAVDAAVNSRFIRCELSGLVDQPAKRKKTAELQRAVGDMAAFRRRVFRSLPRILADMDFIRDQYGEYIGDLRQVDMIAPLLAAVWAVQSREPLASTEGAAWMDRWLPQVASLNEDAIEDEDRMIEHLLCAQHMMDDHHRPTVAELLRMAADPADGGTTSAQHALSRIGMKIIDHGVNGSRRTVLAVAGRSDQIVKMLAGTPYEHGYDAQLRRHKLCLNADGPGHPVRLEIGTQRCRLLDWEQFRETYMGNGEV